MFSVKQLTTSFKVLLSVKTGVIIAVTVKPDIPLAQFLRNSLTKFSAITE